MCVGYEPAADPGARVWSQPGTTPLIIMELHHEPILQGIHMHSYIHKGHRRKTTKKKRHKGRHCCSGDRKYSIPCRARCFALGRFEE